MSEMVIVIIIYYNSCFLLCMLRKIWIGQTYTYLVSRLVINIIDLCVDSKYRLSKVFA